MLIFAIGLVGILIIYAMVGAGENRTIIEKYQEDVSAFESPWIIKNYQKEMVAVDGVAKISAEKNTPIIIVNTLPEKVYRNENILFRSSQQEMIVRVDNKIIYEYQPLLTQKIGTVAASAWHIIPIESEYSEKEIEIEITSQIQENAGYINEPMYGSYSGIRMWMYNNYGTQCIISLAIIFYGLTVLGLSFFITKTYKKSVRHLSAFSLTSGIWAIGESKLVEFFLWDPYVWRIIVFLALMLIPLTYSLFARELLDVKSKRHTILLTGALILNVIVQITLYILGVLDFAEMLPLTHISIVACVVIYVYDLFTNQQRFLKLKSHRFLYLFGSLAALLCVAIEFYSFYTTTLNMTGVYIRVGILLYLLLLLFTISNLLMNMIDETVKLNKEITNYRVAIAMSQIKPHFVFNVLTSIRTLIKTKPEVAYDVIGNLSKYIRVNMASMSNEQLIPFEKELQHIRIYVNIEKVRFGDRIKFICMADDTDFDVPALCIQPLVENAIKHGVCKKIGGGVVMLRSFKVGKTHIIEVVDDGVGFVESEIDGKKNIGISNIRFRLTTLVNAKLVIKSQPGVGTKVRVEVTDDESKEYESKKYTENIGGKNEYDFS